MKSNLPKLVYLSQFSIFWKVTFDEFVAILKDGYENGGYTLPDNRELKRRPKFFYHWADNDDRGHFSSSSDEHKLYNILDWEKSDFKSALKAIKKGEMPIV